VTSQIRDERYHLAVTVVRADAPWRIDVTLRLRDAYLNITRWHEDLRERIMPAQRIAVLRNKDLWHWRPAYPDQVGGLDTYTAVIEDSVYTPHQFAAWLTTNGLPGTPQNPPRDQRQIRTCGPSQGEYSCELSG
jgi:hypothetical protein